jgi:SAM-dependent methyltransferase
MTIPPSTGTMRPPHEVQPPVYNPRVFDKTDIDEAKRIVLTDGEAGLLSAKRWEVEADWLIRAMGDIDNMRWLDYGCGVGRMARKIIEATTHTTVTGLDISFDMRAHAVAYVGSPRFSAHQPETLGGLRDVLGPVWDAALCFWVLQHCQHPVIDIQRLARSVKPGGLLFVLNKKYRCVPTDQGWVDDGINVFRLVSDAGFKQILDIALPTTIFDGDALFRIYERAR